MPAGVSLWRADVGSDHTAAEQDRAMRDVSLAKKIGEHLERKYPNHYFRVDVDSPQGIAKISHPLMPVRYAYVVRLAELNGDPGMRAITKAGGELLERFNQPRGRRDREKWREASNVTYAKLKHGVLPLEVNIKTSQVRHVMPAELAL